MIEEQWEAMVRVAISLKQRTCPAHLIVQRLTSSSPSDRLSKAFTNLGRIIKTEYILSYLSDLSLRRKVHLLYFLSNTCYPTGLTSLKMCKQKLALGRRKTML